MTTLQDIQSSTQVSHESPSERQNNHSGEPPLEDFGSVSASSNDNRKVSRQDIELVQNLIERCLQLYMNRDEVVKTLLTRARIDPGFTTLVWQKLEEENADFFRAYYIRLKLKKQILLFNHLLEHQFHLMNYPMPAKVTLAPIQNGTHPMPVNMPMGYPVLQQPPIPAPAQPHIDSMRCGISSCHVVNGVPAPGNFQSIRMNSGNEMMMGTSAAEIAPVVPPGSVMSEMSVSPKSAASSGHFPFSASDMSGIGVDTSALDTTFTSDVASSVGLQLGPDGGAGNLRDSLRSLDQIPWNFSLSDLTADLSNLGDLGALGNYPGSPFLPSDSEILLDSSEPEDMGNVDLSFYLSHLTVEFFMEAYVSELYHLLKDTTASSQREWRSILLILSLVNALSQTKKNPRWCLAMEASDRRTIQLFVRLLNGKVRTVQFPSPSVYGDGLKQRIFEITRIPIHAQRLVYGNRQVDDTTAISQSDGTVHLLLRLLGGKGGFGSLLRGAATKAGQKKTNNFDACRDMSGRRLRHVNAEKRLEEWKAEEEERGLEKMAEEFLKKKAKKGKRGAGDGEAEKYVEKYREQSAKCVAVVEESVREAFGNGNGKRKGKLTAGGAEAKKLKIWMGKRKFAESDSDGMDSNDDDENENEKSVVLNNGILTDSNREAEGSSDSITGGKQDGARSGGGSCDSSEEENETVVLQISESGECSDIKDVTYEENGVVLPDVHGKKAVTFPCSEAADISDAELVQTGGPMSSACESKNIEEADCQTLKVLIAENGEGPQSKPIAAEVNGFNDSESVVPEETAAAQSEAPLNFDKFNSAAEMEALGMERLKLELLGHGLKCGGTLQERAARLFLLKSTPIEKLPKKLLAKK